MPTPVPTPRPTSSIPTGKTLQDLMNEHFGMPPPPSVEDKYTPEQIQHLLKIGKLHEYLQGRYGWVTRKESDLEDTEQEIVRNHPKMGIRSGEDVFPNEPGDEYRKWYFGLHPTPTVTPTPTVYNTARVNWPAWFRVMLANNLNLPETPYWDRWYSQFIAMPSFPVRSGGK